MASISITLNLFFCRGLLNSGVVSLIPRDRSDVFGLKEGGRRVQAHLVDQDTFNRT